MTAPAHAWLLLLLLGCDPDPPVEICSGGLDEDGDGRADDGDPDCATERCATPGDEDRDGLADASDPDCAGFWGEVCGNGLDDDGDGLADCDDPACWTACGVEDCSNGADDDGDGLLDCEDSACAGHPRCREDCSDGLDDDDDGLVDCQDDDCWGTLACTGEGTVLRSRVGGAGALAGGFWVQTHEGDRQSGQWHAGVDVWGTVRVEDDGGTTTCTWSVPVALAGARLGFAASPDCPVRTSGFLPWPVEATWTLETGHPYQAWYHGTPTSSRGGWVADPGMGGGLYGGMAYWTTWYLDVGPGASYTHVVGSPPESR